MAIAFDAASQGSGNTGTLTISHTCSGNNRALVVHCAKDYTAISGITYNSVALTQVETGGSGGESSSLWLLLNPDSGTHDIVASFTPTPSLYLHAASYTGVKQTGQPQEVTNNQVTGNLALTIDTSPTDNCWGVIGSKDQGNGVTAGSGTTLRGTYDIGCIADSNGPKTPAGNLTLTLNCPSGTHTGSMLVLEPSTTETAAVSPVAVSVAIPAVTADYDSVVSASVSPVSLQVTITAVSAQFTETASVAPVGVTVTVPAVTAVETATASVSPVVIQVAVSALAPFIIVNASVSPLSVTVTAPAVTAASVATASVSPVAITVTILSFTPAYVLTPIPEATSAGGFPFALDLCSGANVEETLHTPIINVKGWSDRINAPGKMVFYMNKNHAEATDDNLRLWKNIRLYRRKRDGTAEMEAVWYGVIIAKREVGEYIEVLCHGALRIFVKRYTGASETFTGQGSTEAFGLLSDANVTGNTGVTEGTGAVTATLDLTLDHVEMLRAFEQIHSATGGEFEVDPLGALNSVQSLGSDKSATVELIFRRDGQEGNLISYEIAEDGEPMANRIIGTSTAGGGLTSTYNHPTSTDDYPVLVEYKAFNQAQDQTTLDALTEAYGLQRGLPIPDFRAVPATAVKKFNTITGEREISGLQYGDIVVGDLVLVTVITPNRNESVAKRVAEVIVDVDENLNEEFRFTLTEAGVFVTERYLDDNEMRDIKTRIQEIEQSL